MFYWLVLFLSHAHYSPHQMVFLVGYVFVCFLQWIQCDMRYFDMTVLGKFSVVMADPPWDIHMEVQMHSIIIL